MSKYRVKLWVGEVSGTQYYAIEKLVWGAFWNTVPGHSQHLNLEEALGVAKALKEQSVVEPGRVWYID